MNNKTLIRGESLSINVKLDYDGIPFSEIDHGEIIANAWFQNNVRVPLIVTQLEGDGEYNLYSDIDTRKLKGESFLVNIVVNRIEGDAPEDLIMATFNQTFYIVNSATDMDNRPLLTGGHSVVYLVDGEYYACESYPEGASIVPITAPTKSGYQFVSWLGLPSIMPSRCVVATAYYEEDFGDYSEGLLFEIIDENTCMLAGRGTCGDSIINVPPTHTFPDDEITRDVVGVKEYAFIQDYSLESIKLPDSIILIQHMAFSQCINLSQIAFPNNESFIVCSGAFERCGFVDLHIPANFIPEYGDYSQYVEVRGTSIFSNCNKLETVTIDEGFTIADPEYVYRPNTLPHYTWCTSGNGMFSVCSKLKSLTLPASCKVIPPSFLAMSGIELLTVKGQIKYLCRDIVSQANVGGHGEHTNINIRFLNDAPLNYSSFPQTQHAFNVHAGSTYYDVKIFVNIEYDGTKQGWTSFKNNNWTIDSEQPELTWIDTSQQGG